MEWLKEATGLDDERLRALECLAVTHLKAHQNDLRLSLKCMERPRVHAERADRDR